MIKSSILAGFLLAASATAPAFGFALTLDDLGYLESLGVEKTSPLMRSLSPRQSARIHNIINAEWAKNDPEKRATSVHEALREVLEQHEWQDKNPGKIWDASRR